MRARTRALTALLPAVAVILTAGLAAAPPAAAVPAASDPGAGQLLVQYKRTRRSRRRPRWSGRRAWLRSRSSTASASRS